MEAGSSHPLRAALLRIANSVDGICQMFVCDRDGIPVMNAASKSSSSTELHIRPPLLAAYPAALEQAKKLQLGAQRHLTIIYNNYQLVLFNFGVLTVTLVATADSNTALLLTLRQQLEPLVHQIHEITTSVLPKE